MQAIRAARVLTPQGWLENATVRMAATRIEAVETGAVEAADDWGDVALIPGAVNAHGHAFQNILRGFADDRPFESWRDDVLYPFSKRLTAPDIYVASLFAFAEALRAGATTTVDFFYLHDAGNTNALEVARAARDVGIRLVLARAFYDLDAPTAAPPRYREEATDAADRCRALASSLSDFEGVTVQPAPHSLHAASPDTLAVAREVARDLDVPWHLHVAEAAYEREQVTARYGTTPVRLLEREGLLDPSLIVVHAVWVDDEEMDMLAEAGVAVVHCPGANAFLGDGIAPLDSMLERGVAVALGADGGCANNRQSPFDEMRLASLFAKARARDGSRVDAATAFDLGTRVGARTLRVDAGEIAPGKLADFVALDLHDLSLQPVSMLDRNLVHSLQPTAISKAVVGGDVVMDGGRLTRIDEHELAALINDITSGWVRP